MSELLARNVERFRREGIVAGTTDARRRWVTVPVPLHWKRRWERGYNQAETLARSLAARLGVQSFNALKRVAETQPLAFRSRTERFETMKYAFQGSLFARGRTTGKRVLLVDDVLTTGATMSSAAKRLKSLGAERVIAVVVCRT